MKLMLMILTCRKYKWKTEKQKKLWLDGCAYPYVIVVGDPEQDVPCRYAPPYLTVKCDDTYEGLYRKIILAEKYLLEHFDFTHLYKLDDDVLVKTDELHRLEEFVGAADYCGARINCKTMDKMWAIGKVTNPAFNGPYSYPINYDYACGGNGYVLSRRAVQLLADEWEKAEFVDQEFLFEDAGFGQVLGRAGIQVHNIPTTEFVVYEGIK